MSAMRVAVPVFFSLLLANCGTYVPEIQEPPFGQDAQQQLVQAIVTSVHCEVTNAVVSLYDYAATHPDVRPMTRKMSTWGVQIRGMDADCLSELRTWRIRRTVERSGQNQHPEFLLLGRRSSTTRQVQDGPAAREACDVAAYPE
jgi:hypothetical protein